MFSRLDCPFLYLVKYVQINHILGAGVMANPAKYRLHVIGFSFLSKTEMNDSLLLIETDEKKSCSILILVYISGTKSR